MNNLHKQLRDLAERGTPLPIDDVISNLRNELTVSDPKRQDPEMLEITTDPDASPARAGRFAFAAAALTITALGGAAVLANASSNSGNDAAQTAAATDGDTTDATTPGDGQSVVPEHCEESPPATLYLGGPPSEQNLAEDGFIYSLSEGTGVVDVATNALATSVIGQGCGAENPANLRGTDNADGTVTVVVMPPAAPSEMTVEVTVAQLDTVVGVTGMQGAAQFLIGEASKSPTLTLTGGIPSAASNVSVRFKKGDNVWELSVQPEAGTPIELKVPEVDGFPDANIDWVLFTIRDDAFHVIDVGGAVLR